jgi:acetyltransferase-like isoleucine patch superfamily enzyme
MNPATDQSPFGADRALVAAPANVVLGERSFIVGDEITRGCIFSRFRSRRSRALVIGDDTVADGVAFNIGKNGVIRIGDGCRLEDAYLIAEQGITLGNRVIVGWHATLVDSDLHPVSPAEREIDARAISPAGDGKRILASHRPIHVGDDVWIGPLAVILKGVTIGHGAIIEPGAVITRDVPAGARMVGNPARRMEGADNESH